MEACFVIQADGGPVGLVDPQSDGAGSVGLGPRQDTAEQLNADPAAPAVRGNPHRDQLGIHSPVAGPVATHEADPASCVVNGDHDGQGLAVLRALRSFHPLRRRQRCFLLPGRGKSAGRIFERGQPDLPVFSPVAALHGVDAHPRRVVPRRCGPQTVSRAGPTSATVARCRTAKIGPRSGSGVPGRALMDGRASRQQGQRHHRARHPGPAAQPPPRALSTPRCSDVPVRERQHEPGQTEQHRPGAEHHRDDQHRHIRPAQRQHPEDHTGQAAQCRSDPLVSRTPHRRDDPRGTADTQRPTPTRQLPENRKISPHDRLPLIVCRQAHSQRTPAILPGIVPPAIPSQTTVSIRKWCGGERVTSHLPGQTQTGSQDFRILTDHQSRPSRGDSEAGRSGHISPGWWPRRGRTAAGTRRRPGRLCV